VCGREALGGAPGSDGTVGPAGDGSGEPWQRRPGLRPPELAAESGRRQLTTGHDGRRCRRIRARGGAGRAALDWCGQVCSAAARRWTAAAAALKRWRRRANELGELASRGRGWVGLGHDLKAFGARPGQVAALHAREEAAAPVRGHAGPAGRPPRLGWARCTALCEGDVPTVLSGSTATTPRHRYTGAMRGRHVANAVRVRARRSGARHSDVGDSNQFRDSVFKFTKTPKSVN
jgi:hypothetical protein